MKKPRPSPDPEPGARNPQPTIPGSLDTVEELQQQLNFHLQQAQTLANQAQLHRDQALRLEGRIVERTGRES